MWVSVTELFQGQPRRMYKGWQSAPLRSDYTCPASRCGFEILGRLMRLLEHSPEPIFISNRLLATTGPSTRVVEIFNRLNSGGTQLSKADLALARSVCRFTQGPG